MGGLGEARPGGDRGLRRPPAGGCPRGQGSGKGAGASGWAGLRRRCRKENRDGSRAVSGGKGCVPPQPGWGLLVLL